MPQDEEDDFFNEEFDLVDDEDDASADEASDVAEEDEPVPASGGARESRSAKRSSARRDEESGEEADGEKSSDENLDEFGRPKPVANYVVHVYEYKKFKRTIDRAFTPEEAEALATEYNRTAKSYGRIAVAGKNDVPPAKDLPAQKAAS